MASGITKIILFDEHTVTRQSIAASFNEETGIAVLEASGSLSLTLKHTRELAPDVLILAIRDQFPRLDWLTELHRISPRTRVLLLTPRIPFIYRAEVLKSDLFNYLDAKQATITELQTAIKQIARNRSCKDIRLISDELARSILINNTRLSRREMEVFWLAGRAYTNDEIADELAIETETVKTHIRRIRDKLQLTERGDIVRIVMQEHFFADDEQA